MFREGLYQPHLNTHVEVLIFIFLPIIQTELNEFARTWNSRNVRQSSSAPGGKPDILFTSPETVGFSNKGIPVDLRDLVVAENLIGISHHPIWKNKDMYELLVCYLSLNRLKQATNPEDGLDLYVKLLSFLNNDGFHV